ncbi:GNAT family N-acetyltransferase [Verrucomicrobiales bacterium BCK34]|nr:GNAT family N-acetyltransferase [Verrucomicrobiales bacterium BCK34]
MRLLTYNEFCRERKSFQASVAQTPGIAEFCSGPVWQQAAHDFLHSISNEANHLIVEEDGQWLTFVERDQPRVFFPLESAWMFGCPLIGDPARAVALLREVPGKITAGPIGFCIGGVRKEGQLHRELEAIRDETIQFEIFPTTDCMILDLSDGFESWLQRRSKKFRKGLRQSRGLTGLEIDDASQLEPDTIIERIIRLQRQTYKWAEGTDIFQMKEYAAFYDSIIRQLHSAGELSVLFATEHGEDLAYIFGGISGQIYRGFQMSYIDSAKDRGIGNALQMENIKRAAASGVTRYDLGMHSPYKERWADLREEYIAIFAVFA